MWRENALIDPLYAASGLLVGVLVGLTGVGGGSLMTPLLILLFGIHPTTAVGTDLLFAACTKAVGATIHAHARTIDWHVTGRLALGSIPITALTVLIISLMSAHTDAVSHVITPILGVTLLGTALLLLFQQQALHHVSRLGASLRPQWLTGLTAMAGGVLGLLVSLSSVGAGALGITMLGVLYPRLPAPKIVGSDIAHAIPLTLLAGTGYWMMGSVDWTLLGSLLSGSVPGVMLGSLVATRLPTAAVRVVLAATLAIAAARMLA